MILYDGRPSLGGIETNERDNDDVGNDTRINYRSTRSTGIFTFVALAMLCPWSFPLFGGSSTVDRIPTLRPRLLRTTNRGHTVTTRVLRKAPERASIVTPKTPAGDLACPDVFTASVANGYVRRQRSEGIWRKEG